MDRSDSDVPRRGASGGEHQMLGHARMETTQIYTHVHIDALREIHARTHPHGRLDETHDMYGLISAIETPEHDLPSPPAENPLQPEAMWAATAPGREVSAAQAGISNGSCPEPPDEEPPAGGSPCATPKPPPTGGPSSAKSPLDPHEPAQKSTEIQRFRPGVAYYGYRWFDPATGRWPSRDPIEEAGGVNLYGFVGNDGVGRWDYLGWYGPMPGYGPGWEDTYLFNRPPSVSNESRGDATVPSVAEHILKNILNSKLGFSYNKQAADYFTDISNMKLDSSVIDGGLDRPAEALLKRYPDLLQKARSEGKVQVNHSVLWYSSARAMTIGHIHLDVSGELKCIDINNSTIQWEFNGKATARADKFDFNQMIRPDVTDNFDFGMWFYHVILSHSSGWFYIKPENDHVFDGVRGYIRN